MNLQEASRRIERLEEDFKTLEDRTDFIDVWVSCPHCDQRLRVRGSVKAEKLPEESRE